MHYCILYVLSMLTFTQLLRYSQRRGLGVLPVSAINYVAAAILCAGAMAVLWTRGGVDLSNPWVPIALGVPNGVLYFVHLLIILTGYRLAGVGITMAFAAMGVLIPVLLSWYTWGEPMPPSRWAAVAILPVAAVLMRPNASEHKHLTLKGDIVLAMTLLMGGTVATIHKSFDMYAQEAARPLYLTSLFTAAAITSVVYVWARRLRYRWRGVVIGSILGGANSLATLFVLLGLSVLPAVVFYPISGSLVISCSVVVSWLLWRERITRRQMLGVCSAVVIVALANA